MDWRSWTAADRAAITYLLLQRDLKNDPAKLRELFLLVGDRAKAAEVDRATMGQSGSLETTR